MLVELKNGKTVQATCKGGHFYDLSNPPLDISKEVVCVTDPKPNLPPADPSHPKHRLHKPSPLSSSTAILSHPND